VNWLSNPNTAIWCVIVVSIWKTIGFNLLLYLAALEAVPNDYIEAASWAVVGAVTQGEVEVTGASAVDLEPTTGTAPSNWTVTQFATLGGSGSPKRKFFFPPDVVTTKDFDMVMAGTGDREHPLTARAPRPLTP